MTDALILAIDQGTTNTKAIVLSQTGTIMARASVPMQVSYPHPGWAEQSAFDIWRSVRHVVAEAVAPVDASIAAIAISNQRETIVVWDAQTGEPIAPAVIWQCRRTAERCAALRQAGHELDVIARTGLALDPLFPAAKIAWILDSIPGARARARSGALRAGTVDSWLLWNLTGGHAHATDHSNASRTQLFNTKTLEWDARLLEIFGVPNAILPAIMTSDSRFGETVDGVTALPGGVPIHAMLGDSHAALFGHGVRQPGLVKATYGTGSSLMTLTASRLVSTHGLSGTIAWSTGSGVAYALEGNISVSGQAAAYMAEILGVSDVAELSRLAETVANSNGAVFVPALVGLGAPYWHPEARGLVTGLALGTGRAHLARAAIEAIAFQVADVFGAMEADLGASLAGLSVDGGASRNDLLMQFQADILNRRVIRTGLAELSAFGAAAMAAFGLGFEESWQPEEESSFDPVLSEAERDSKLAQWRKAIAQTLA